jgi:8-amino-7-oxononanoate synthase
LIVDEAHGFGIIGPQGMGGTCAAGLSQAEVPLRIIPFGKALAGSGAVVVGQAVWIDALLQATRQPVYSTSISPAMAHGMLTTLSLLQEADDRRQQITHLIAYFRQHIQQSAYVWRDSLSPIQQLQLGCPHLAMQMTEKLAKNGIRCFAIRQPTVPKQETGLRIVLNYHHTPHDIDRLFEVLRA